ncbi:hypothetical protein WJX84_008393 [Apatococcus fuscideae]|uniref:BZIP domain-containing protein n=1 Tax=Apatococcus fuscideae TaxID=2026836 RepID=A0AAW1SYS6_9CHLO
MRSAAVPAGPDQHAQRQNIVSFQTCGKPIRYRVCHRSSSVRPGPTRASQRDGAVSAGAQDTAGAAAAGSAQPVEIPTKLNNIPHTHHIRRFFYADVTQATKKALSAGKQRITLRVTIPELNPEMDVFRVGTLLEMVREMAVGLAQDGQRVKVSVQQAMGQGVFQGLPLSLSGVRRIMEAMEWGDAEDFVSFGQVSADQIDDSEYYILIAPQNVVGNTIMTNLQEMVDAAEDQGKSVILINPKLTDVPSSGGVMGVRGRKERMAFASSFDAAYHFRLLYLSSAMMYPIMGALRHVHGEPWQVYRRADTGRREEEYQLLGTYDDQPSTSEITLLFSKNQRQREEASPCKRLGTRSLLPRKRCIQSLQLLSPKGRRMGQQVVSHLPTVSCEMGSSDSELERRLPQGPVVKRREKRRAANREAARRLRQRRQEQVLQLEGELVTAHNTTEQVTRKLGHVQSAHRKAVAELQILRAELAGLKMSMGLSAPLSQLDIASASLAASTGVLPSAHLLTMPAPLFPTGLLASSQFAAQQAHSLAAHSAYPDLAQTLAAAAIPTSSQLPTQAHPQAEQHGPGRVNSSPISSGDAPGMPSQSHRSSSSPTSAYRHLEAPARGLLDAVALHFHSESETFVSSNPARHSHQAAKDFTEVVRDISVGSQHSAEYSHNTGATKTPCATREKRRRSDTALQ